MGYLALFASLVIFIVTLLVAFIIIFVFGLPLAAGSSASRRGLASTLGRCCWEFAVGSGLPWGRLVVAVGSLAGILVDLGMADRYSSLFFI